MKLGAAAGALGAAYVATYPRWRNWCLTWGARLDEADAVLPGDDLMPSAGVVSTRAIGIDAPASCVWPWLVQMGPGRAGAYTYDWIENLLGLNMHSADNIVPEYQDLRVGDAWRLGTGGPVLGVAVLEAERAMVLRSDDGRWIWAFTLSESPTGTRLVSRNRIALGAAKPLSRAITTYVMEPGSLVMERKMLLGIKARAERTQRAGIHGAEGAGPGHPRLVAVLGEGPSGEEEAMGERMDPSELITAEEAVGLLEVAPSRIDVLVEEGLLSPLGDGSERRFSRIEVLALRELGG